MCLTCCGASFSETSHSISDEMGTWSLLKWPRRLRATLSAETDDSLSGGMIAVDKLRPDGMGDGAEAGNNERRLGVSPCRSELGGQITGVPGIDAASLLENDPLFRAIRRERTRLRRANFRDFCRSFSNAEQMDVNEIPFIVNRIFRNVLELQAETQKYLNPTDQSDLFVSLSVYTPGSRPMKSKEKQLVS